MKIKSKVKAGGLGSINHNQSRIRIKSGVKAGAFSPVRQQSEEPRRTQARKGAGSRGLASFRAPSSIARSPRRRSFLFQLLDLPREQHRPTVDSHAKDGRWRISVGRRTTMKTKTRIRAGLNPQPLPP
jgi:hypothetical protein